MEHLRLDDHASDNKLSLHELAAKNEVKKIILKLESSISSHGDIVEVVNSRNCNYETPLIVAAECNKDRSHFEVIEVLLKYGADPNAKDSFGCTPLRLMINYKSGCSIDILKLFKKFNADFTLLIQYRKFRLEQSIQNYVADVKKLDVVKFLVQETGFDKNENNEFFRTLLQHVAEKNHIDSHYEVLKYLLERGADPNFQDSNGSTPLWCLLKKGNWKVVELFLNHNADVHVLNNNGQNILSAFYDRNSNVHVLNKLINEFGLHVNHQDDDGKTPLHHIIGGMSVKIVKCLLKNGASINTPDKYGTTAIIEAVWLLSDKEDGDYEKNWLWTYNDYFNLLVEQTNFSIVYHNDLQILENLDFPPYLKLIFECILEHLAKLKFLNIPMHENVHEFIQNRTYYKGYFDKCIFELKLMSKTKLQNSWVTFINLLVDSRRKLKNYAGNEDLIQDFKNKGWFKMFPVYGTLIKKNMDKGIKRRKLFDESSILLSDCLPIINPNHLIVKDILDCIMGKKDLSTFCE